MSPSTAVLPNPKRADVGGIHATRVYAGSVERQEAVVDAVFAAYEASHPEGLLTLTGYVNPDGEDAFVYAQLSSQDASSRFLQDSGSQLAAAVEQAAPGTERVETTEYGLYKSYVTPDAAAAATPPGLVIVVTIRFDDPERPQGWIDTTLEALREVEPVDGLITNYFHIELGGTRVINYTEWTDKEKHKAAHSSDSGPIGQNGAVGKRIKSLPGVVGIDVARYLLHRSFAA